MRISKSYFEVSGHQMSCFTPFTLQGKSERLRVSVDLKQKEMLSDRSDGPLVALFMLAMLHGESIEVEGPLSPRLFSELSGSSQAIIRCILPELNVVKISASDLTPNPIQGAEVATAFSGGVDAFYTLKKFFYDTPAPGMRITRLTLANVGAYFDGGELLIKHYKKLLPLTEKLGLPFHSIDTNIKDLYKGKIHFLRYFPVANSAVALFLQNNLQYYYISSGQTYADQQTGPSERIDDVESILLPTFSTESLKLMVIGSATNRTEKTALISEEPDVFEYLNVCIKQHVGNCSSCYKCLRTLMTLELIGSLKQSNQIFDLATYQKLRVSHFHNLYKEYGQYMIRDLREFAHGQGFKFPLQVRLMAPFWTLKYYQWHYKKRLKKILRRRSRKLA